MTGFESNTWLELDMFDGPNQEDGFPLFHLIVGVNQVFAAGEISPKSGIQNSSKNPFKNVL